MNQGQVITALLAGAVGDGWGACYEGSLPAGEAHLPQKLFVTDDTQLTLATCEAIVLSQRVDPESIANRLLAWFREGRLTGVGSCTLKALRDLANGAHWAIAGASGEYAAGNGAAMRVAPLAFVLDLDSESARRTFRDVCRITHRNDEAYAGALAVATAIQLAGSGVHGSHLLSQVAATLPDSCVKERIIKYSEYGPDVTPRKIAESWGNSGYVAESVPLAIWSAREPRSRPLVETIRAVVAAGGDTDTIASISAQILGVGLGPTCLPPELLARLEERELVLRHVTNFAQFLALPD